MDLLVFLILMPLILIGFFIMLAIGNFLINLSNHPGWLLGGGLAAWLAKKHVNKKESDK